MKKTEESDILGDELAEGLSTLLDTPEKVSQTRRFMDMLVGYRELMMMYTCALKEVRTKFEVLDTEFSVRYQRNPISSVSTRLKHTNSIMAKLDRYGYGFSVDNIEKYIHDAAGIRIICSYIDDIYGIADALLNQDDITLVTRKDYIINPKPNGYRSLHLIVEVPVYFANFKKNMKVEVQIRTIAMDFWASLEHQLKYKQNVRNQQEIVAQLTECSNVIAQTDEKMLDIRRQIEESADIPTEDDILLDKVSKLDVRIG